METQAMLSNFQLCEGAKIMLLASGTPSQVMAHNSLELAGTLYNQDYFAQSCKFMRSLYPVFIYVLHVSQS